MAVDKETAPLDPFLLFLFLLFSFYSYLLSSEYTVQDCLLSAERSFSPFACPFHSASLVVSIQCAIVLSFRLRRSVFNFTSDFDYFVHSSLLSPLSLRSNPTASPPRRLTLTRSSPQRHRHSYSTHLTSTTTLSSVPLPLHPTTSYTPYSLGYISPNGSNLAPTSPKRSPRYHLPPISPNLYVAAPGRMH